MHFGSTIKAKQAANSCGFGLISSYSIRVNSKIIASMVFVLSSAFLLRFASLFNSAVPCHLSTFAAHTYLPHCRLLVRIHIVHCGLNFEKKLYTKPMDVFSS